LHRLYLEGQQSGIEVLCNLTTLERLTLRSISTDHVGYLERLDRIWSLEAKLGGIKDFSVLEGKQSLNIWSCGKSVACGILVLYLH